MADDEDDLYGDLPLKSATAVVLDDRVAEARALCCSGPSSGFWQNHSKQRKHRKHREHALPGAASLCGFPPTLAASPWLTTSQLEGELAKTKAELESERAKAVGAAQREATLRQENDVLLKNISCIFKARRTSKATPQHSSESSGSRADWLLPTAPAQRASSGVSLPAAS